MSRVASCKMNRMLFDCGIKKSVETRKGEKFDITNILLKSVKQKDYTMFIDSSRVIF